MTGVLQVTEVTEHGSRRERRGGRGRRGGPARGRRRAAVPLALLAVLLLGAGALLATAARPTQRVSSTLPSTAAAPLVVLSPQLLASRDGRVAVSARGDGPVLVARGSAGDVAAWAEGTATTTATDLDDDGAVRVERADGASSAPDPAGSDLWAAQQRGDGSAELVLDAAAARGPGAQAVLVAADGTSAAPARVEVTWSSRPVPLVAPLLASAGAACAVGAAVCARPLARRRPHGSPGSGATAGSAA